MIKLYKWLGEDGGFWTKGSVYKSTKDKRITTNDGKEISFDKATGNWKETEEATTEEATTEEEEEFYRWNGCNGDLWTNGKIYKLNGKLISSNVSRECVFLKTSIWEKVEGGGDIKAEETLDAEERDWEEYVRLKLKFEGTIVI